MDSTVIAAVGLAFIVGGFVKGTVGFGLPAAAIALLGTMLGVREAIPLMAVPAVLFNVFQAEVDRSLLPIARRFWSLLVTIAIGIWGGTHFMTAVDARLLSTILGALLPTYAVLSLLKVRVRLPPRSEPYLSPIIGGTSGLLAGLTGTILVPFVFYMQALSLGRDEFVRAVGLALLVASTFWITALVQTGVLTFDRALLSLAAMIPTGIGFVFGLWCRRRLSQEHFRTWVMVGLLLTGLNLLRKGLFPL